MSREEKWIEELNAEHDRLRPLYDEMTAANGGNWKISFDAVVPADEFDDYSAAAVFFAGAPLVKTNTDYDHTGICEVSFYAKNDYTKDSRQSDGVRA